VSNPTVSTELDWNAYLAQARELDRPLTDDELKRWKSGTLDGSARMYNEDYVHAVQKALEGRDSALLESMMEAKIPIPSFLLPAVAKIWISKGGRPAALTAVEDARIRWFYNQMTKHLRMEDAVAKQELSRLLGLHKKTIDRSLARTKDQD
jgi:hypothetical protein